MRRRPAALLLAAALAGGRSGRAAAVLALPWLAREPGRRGRGAPRLAVNAVELPARAVRDAAKVVVFALGSARHRTLVL